MSPSSIFNNRFSNAYRIVFFFGFSVIGTIGVGQAGTIHVLVRSPEGQALERVLVSAFDKYDFESSGPEPAYTDSAGHVVFSNLKDGIYMVGAVGAEMPYQPVDNIQVRGESETHVVLKPVSFSLYDLSGRVLNPRENVPVSNAVVTLLGQAIPIHDMEELMKSHQTFPDGSFRYLHLYPGEYSICIDTSEHKGMVDFKMGEDGSITLLNSMSVYTLELTAEKSGGEIKGELRGQTP